MYCTALYCTYNPNAIRSAGCGGDRTDRLLCSNEREYDDEAQGGR